MQSEILPPPKSMGFTLKTPWVTEYESSMGYVQTGCRNTKSYGYEGLWVVRAMGYIKGLQL